MFVTDIVDSTLMFNIIVVFNIAECLVLEETLVALEFEFGDDSLFLLIIKREDLPVSHTPIWIAIELSSF